MPRRVDLIDCVATRHLANQFFEMSEKLGVRHECPVCLEAIVPTSGLLLTCGHALHAQCWIYAADVRCPVCRD